MHDQPDPLTGEERRALSDIERNLRPDLRSLDWTLGGGGRPRWSPRLPTWTGDVLAAGAVVTGAALVAAGLVAAAVLLSFAGFVAMVAGVDRLSQHPAALRLAERLRPGRGERGPATDPQGPR